MSSRREDMHAALGRRVPDRVPTWELEFHHWDPASGEHLVLGREFEALSPSARRSAIARNTDIIVSVAEELHFAAVTVPGGFWEIAPGEPAYLWLPDEARIAQLESLARAAGGRFSLVANSGGVMAIPASDQYVEFAYKLFDAPEEVDGMARRTYEEGIEWARRLVDAGADVILTASDIADNHGPYFNPKQMDRFVLPYLTDWAHEVAQLGARSILHTDGNVERYLDLLADSGIDALQAIDPLSGMSVERTREEVGQRLCLCGNVDCGLIIQGPPERVHESASQLLASAAPGGAFVLGASNAVEAQAPFENYRAIVRAWEDYGTTLS